MTLGIYIALGSNLGDREMHLREGLLELCRDGQVRVLRHSRLHETEPVGGPAGQARYLNAAAEIETELSPGDLLRRMLEVEVRFGRIRPSAAGAGSNPDDRNGPRTLDLDLLIYRDRVIQQAGLIVPHPRMWEREFVLRPLAEIADIHALREQFARGRGNSQV